MKKFLCILGLIIFGNFSLNAFAVDNINKVLSDSNIKKDTVSISVKKY